MTLPFGEWRLEVAPLYVALEGEQTTPRLLDDVLLIFRQRRRLLHLRDEVHVIVLRHLGGNLPALR